MKMSMILTAVVSLAACSPKKNAHSQIQASEEQDQWIRQPYDKAPAIHKNLSVHLEGDKKYTFYLGDTALTTSFVLSDEIKQAFPNATLRVSREELTLAAEILASKDLILAARLAKFYEKGYMVCTPFEATQQGFPCHAEVDEQRSSITFTITDINVALYANGLQFYFHKEKMQHTLIDGALVPRKDGTEDADFSTANTALGEQHITRGTLIETPEQKNIEYTRNILATFLQNAQAKINLAGGKQALIKWNKDFPDFE